MERGRRVQRRTHGAHRGERGTHPVLIAVGVVIVLVIAVVVFLLLQKPKQVTPVAVLGTSPSASAAAATPTAVPVTLPPTEAPTPTPLGTSPTFTNFSAPHKVACNGQSTIHPHMTWAVANATGITISIDDPGGVFDSYGPSGATDQQSDPVPFSCSGNFQHTYYFTTTGGTGGPDVTKQVTITGTP
jgi:hypothetical protein